jgi:hypothetical protein
MIQPFAPAPSLSPPCGSCPLPMLERRSFPSLAEGWRAVQVWADILSGRAERDSSLLTRFFLLTFADLKRWDFYYWFAFPALVLPHPARSTPLRPASAVYPAPQLEAMTQACLRWKQGTGPPPLAPAPSEGGAAAAVPPAPSANVSRLSTSLQAATLGEAPGPSPGGGGGGPFFLLHFEADGQVTPHPLHRWSQLQQQGAKVRRRGIASGYRALEE